MRGKGNKYSRNNLSFSIMERRKKKSRVTEASEWDSVKRPGPITLAFWKAELGIQKSEHGGHNLVSVWLGMPLSMSLLQKLVPSPVLHMVPWVQPGVIPMWRNRSKPCALLDVLYKYHPQERIYRKLVFGICSDAPLLFPVLVFSLTGIELIDFINLFKEPTSCFHCFSLLHPA